MIVKEIDLFNHPASEQLRIFLFQSKGNNVWELLVNKQGTVNEKLHHPIVTFRNIKLEDIDIDGVATSRRYKFFCSAHNSQWDGNVTCGLEFGPHNKGKRAKIVKALYGLHSSGASWRSLISETLQEKLNFMPCRADADVWLRPAERADGTKYYEYVLVYTDDLLVLSTDPKAILNHLDQHFLLKKGSVGEPKTYQPTFISTTYQINPIKSVGR